MLPFLVSTPSRSLWPVSALQGTVNALSQGGSDRAFLLGLFAGGYSGFLVFDRSQSFQDAAFSTPSGDADPVGGEQGLSGTRDMTQGTGSAKPTMAYISGGKFYLGFDGGDHMVGANIPITGACEGIFGLRATGGAGTYRSPFSQRNSAATTQGDIVYVDDGNRWAYWTGSGGAAWNQVAGASASLNTDTVIGIRRSGATMVLSVNTDDTSMGGQTFSETTSDFTFGCGNTVADPQFKWVGRISPTLFINRILTTAERTRARAIISSMCETPPL